MAEAVLVAGGAGYVGAHACKALAQAGFLPVVLDNLATGHSDFVRWGPLVRADLCDRDTVAETIRRHACIAVLHFAAFANVGESVTDPAKYYANNVAGTLALLGAMQSEGCKALVFSSTCAVYGEPAEIPIREETPLAPINPYGASKLMVERILADFRAAYGLSSVALRYFNACGADPEGEIGELHDPETHLIPRAMLALLGYIADFAVFGEDYATADGTAVRDYVHVSDLAGAHIAAVANLLGGAPGGVFNLGTGRGYSVKEVLAAIEREAGAPVPRVSLPRRAGDPPVLVAEASRARRELGFAPVHSDLASIVRTAWAWHRRAQPRRDAVPAGAQARRAKGSRSAVIAPISASAAPSVGKICRARPPASKR